MQDSVLPRNMNNWSKESSMKNGSDKKLKNLKSSRREDSEHLDKLNRNLRISAKKMKKINEDLNTIFMELDLEKKYIFF